MHYVGRFAPSPTGPLHLGSLVTAVASFLHARQAGGEWLVRIEDIDPPREARGAADGILRTLEAFELEWDRTVLYQSARFAFYRETAEQLLASRRAFRCRCTRTEIRSANDSPTPRYPGTCRELHLMPADTSIRVRVDAGTVRLADGLQGAVSTDVAASTGDYVIVRRDGLPAYHLAVVVDDAAQGVTTVVRGVDLLDSTAVHMHLQAVLGLRTPPYYHVPVVVDALGHKLSKQTGAAGVTTVDPAVIARILALLGLRPPTALHLERPRAVWQWALEHWQIEALRNQRSLFAASV